MEEYVLEVQKIQFIDFFSSNLNFNLFRIKFFFPLRRSNIDDELNF